MSHEPDEAAHLRAALESLWRGDLAHRMPAEAGAVAARHNQFLDRLQRLTAEVGRVSREVGGEGIFGAQAQVPDAEGTWGEVVRGVNAMSANLTAQVREVARVVHAIGRGELHWKVHGDVHGEMQELKDMLNALTDRVHAVIREVAQVAREIGEEGRPGGQIRLEDLGGYWKYLTDSVNKMSGALARQAEATGLP